MIIRNEKDRLKAMRMIEDAELPCQILITGENYILGAARSSEESLSMHILYQYAGDGYFEPVYPDTPEPELGDHPSGMEEGHY